MITVPTLIAAGIAVTQARQWAAPLADAAARFGIDTPARLAGWLSQCARESGGLVHVEENLYYSTPERIRAMWPKRVLSLADAATLCRAPQRLANRVYANRNGNGDEASGDGWAYRGRGLIQLTGRANYRAAGAALDLPMEADPDQVAMPDAAALTAAWYFVTHGGLAMADAGDVEAMTRMVNGPAMAGLADRSDRFDAAARAFA